MSSRALEMALALLRDKTFIVDAQGHIWRRIMRDAHGRACAIPLRRAEHPTRKGYLAIVLGIPGTRRTCKVYAHVLLWNHWHGAIPAGMQVNHRDLVKSNNAAENLELVTPSGNIRHSYANGRTIPWSRTELWRGKPRIDATRGSEVRALRDQGLSVSEVSRRTGVSKTHVARLCQKGGV